MSIRFQGCISVDVGDYDGDIDISIDEAADISDLMYQNQISIEEVMEYQGVSGTSYSSVVDWLADGAEAGELFNIIDICARELRLLLDDEVASRKALFKEVNDLKLSKSELVKAIKQFDSNFPDDC